MSKGRFICLEETAEEYTDFVLVGYVPTLRGPIDERRKERPYKFIRIRKKVKYFELLLEILNKLELMNQLEFLDVLSSEDWDEILGCLTRKKALKKLRQILKKKKIKLEESKNAN